VPLPLAGVQQERDVLAVAEAVDGVEDCVRLRPYPIFDDDECVAVCCIDGRDEVVDRLERSTPAPFAVQHCSAVRLVPLAGNLLADRALARPRRAEDDAVAAVGQVRFERS